MGKAEALRRAELSFLDSDTPDQFTDPRFWAFFSLIGDGELSARELLGDILNGLPGSP